MASIHIDAADLEWASAVPFFGPAAVWNGKEIVQLKVLSDRRRDGGGVAWLIKFAPPAGKVMKIIATARSDEHVFPLAGGRTTKSGEPVRAPQGYTLNPRGQPHSAFIGEETVSLIIYSGEPDEVHAVEVTDAAA